MQRKWWHHTLLTTTQSCDFHQLQGTLGNVVQWVAQEDKGERFGDWQTAIFAAGPLQVADSSRYLRGFVLYLPCFSLFENSLYSGQCPRCEGLGDLESVSGARLPHAHVAAMAGKRQEPDWGPSQHSTIHDSITILCSRLLAFSAPSHLSTP